MTEFVEVPDAEGCMHTVPLVGTFVEEVPGLGLWEFWVTLDIHERRLCTVTEYSTRSRVSLVLEPPGNLSCQPIDWIETTLSAEEVVRIAKEQTSLKLRDVGAGKFEAALEKIKDFLVTTDWDALRLI